MLAQSRPAHPSTWLFGEAGGIQVWAVDGDPRMHVAVLIGQGSPIVLLNRALAGTSGEYGAMAWAFDRVASCAAGFYVRLTPDR